MVLYKGSVDCDLAKVINSSKSTNQHLKMNSPCLLPEVAQIPNSFILELRAKQRVGLGQNRYQPAERGKERQLKSELSQTTKNSLKKIAVILTPQV